MKFAALSARQLDILREVSNIGVGHAATALSQMIGRDVSMRVPRVRIAPFSEVPETLGGAEKLMAGVFCSVTGDVTGYILLVFPSDSAKSLGRLLMGRELEPDEGWYEDAESAIGEVGNILSSAYLNALGSLLSMTLIPSIPATAFDMAGAILDTVLIEQSRSDDLALLIETEFFEKEETITGHFFLVPGPESVAVVLEKLGAGPQ